MKEKNKHILRDALKNLPEHEPQDSLWDFIQDDLDYEHSDKRLKEGLQALPSYDPPDLVWENIESNLGHQVSNTSKVVVMKPRRRWLSIAAAVATLLVAGWWSIGNIGNTLSDDGLAYSTEIREDNLLKEDWNDDESAFEDLMAMCQLKVNVCKTPDFQKLQMELDELNEAKEALNHAIGKFGTDPNLISQIKVLEIDRTEIMKKMIEKLI
jgi:hypothetical protein